MHSAPTRGTDTEDGAGSPATGIRSHAPGLRKAALLVLVLVLAAWVFPLGAADYCIDAASGSDAASGLAPNDCWRSFDPTWLFAFQYGDRVLIREGRYFHPRTAWYMLPGVDWIGAGPDRTEVIYNKFVEVPFVRFRTTSDGSGPPADLRSETFGPDTELADLTITNQGDATIGVDVQVSDATSAPTIRNVHVVDFPVGIQLHPASNEMGNATTQATLTRNRIRGATDTGILFYSDVFYKGVVTEASELTNSMIQSSSVGAGMRTFISYVNNYDPTEAVAEPILTNNTITGGTGSASLLISYLDDGTTRWASQEYAGIHRGVLRNNILAAGDRYGIEEFSPFTEPLEVTRNSLGGNGLGDYLDEGSISVAAAGVGTGNLSSVPVFVDLPGGDLHVLGSSPTLDQIPAAEAPSEDFDAQARPEGAAADMGADEYLDCALVVDASRSQVPPPCSGGSVQLDGTATTVDATVCSAGLVYEWYDGVNLIGAGETLAWSPPQETTVTLRVHCDDAALTACRGEDSLSVTPTSPPVTVDAGPDLVLAEGEAAALGGAPTASGGTPDFTYAWTPDPPELDTAADPANPVYSAAAAGSYGFTVQVTDSLGCAGTDTVNVQVVPPVSADAGADRFLPDGGQASLGGTPAASGGEPGYTYAWEPVTDLDDPAAQHPLFTAPAPGSYSYTLTVTDSRGRQAQDSVAIEVADPLAADAGLDRSIQDTETSDLGGTPAASGGREPYGYSWDPAGDLDDPGDAHPVFTPPTTGEFTFTLTVTDDLGSQAQDTVRVTVTTLPPLVVEAGADQEIDISGTARLGGTPAAEGGEEPYDYAWEPTGGLDDPASPNPVFTPQAAGETLFTLTVTDNRQTVAQDQVRVNVTQADPLVADAGPDRTIETGASILLGGNPAGSGGVEPLAYTWSPGHPDLASTSEANPRFTPQSAGVYVFTLTVLDDAGSEADDTVEITVDDPPPGSPPAEVPRLRLNRKLCSTEGLMEVSFLPAARADFHRLWISELGDRINRTNPAAPEGCDWPATTGMDPDTPELFRSPSLCAPGSFSFLVVGVNDAGEGPYGDEDPDADPTTDGPDRPAGSSPACP